jgi:uncharacterized coiled-coil protein SlyX
MTDQLRAWVRENSTLVYFLIAQAVGVVATVMAMTAYIARLENRVTTLEVRGSPHLATVDNRLSILESQTAENKNRIERIVDALTKNEGDGK